MAEYGEQGVLAWSVHPGGVMTELASKMPKHTHGSESYIPCVLLIIGYERATLIGAGSINRYIRCRR